MIIFNKCWYNVLYNFLKRNYSLILIMILGIILRLWGIRHDLPLVSTVGDEIRLISVSIGMLARFSFIPLATLDTYFPLLYYINIIFYLPYLLWLFIINGFSILAVKQAVILDLAGLTLMGRLASFFMGVSTIWLIYGIGKKIFNSRTPAYFAALFFALDPLNVALSHFSRVWAPQTFFIYLSLYFSLCYFGDRYKKLSFREYFLSALFILLSIGVNLPGIFAYFLWLIVIVVYRFEFDFKKIYKFLFSKQSFFFHAVLILGCLLILFLARDSFNQYKEIYYIFFTFSNNFSNENFSIHGWNIVRSTLPLWQRIILSFNAFLQYEIVASILFVPALLLIYCKNKKLFFYLFISFILFFVFLNPPLINCPRLRYLSIMMPFIILPGAWLSAEIFYFLKKNNFLLVLAFMILIILPTLSLSLKNNYLLAKNSSNLELYYWLKDNLKKNEKVFVYGSYMSQDLLPSQQLLNQIKDFSPDYYSERFKYLSNNLLNDWSGGYDIYSDVFFCKFPPEQIEQTDFKYIIINENYDSKIDLSKFKICDLKLVDLSQIKPVFIRNTAPFYKYSILEWGTINENLFAESYRPLFSIKQLGSQIKVYQIIQ